MTTTDDRSTHSEIQANEQGRVTIPAWLRHVTGIRAGSSLVAYEEDGRAVLETREHLADRIRRDVAASWSGDGSAVDELIAERRAEATREAAEEDAS